MQMSEVCHVWMHHQMNELGVTHMNASSNEWVTGTPVFFEWRGPPFTYIKNCLKFLGLPWKLVWKVWGLLWRLVEILAVAIFLRPISSVCGMNASFHTRKWPISVWQIWVIYVCEMMHSYTQMTHICHTRKWPISATHVNASFHTRKWPISDTHVNGSYHTYECVMSHKSKMSGQGGGGSQVLHKSHGTHMR